LLDEVCEICRFPAGTGPALRTEATPGLVAEGDRGQLRRALINLVKNAMVAAGVPGQVVVAARRANGLVEWEVRDSGPGVAPELGDKIFTPFFTTRERGIGLGLAFVREIAHDHGGEVSVDRGEEGGARFRFTSRTRPPT
jgi:signal transduction histidine kinase